MWSASWHGSEMIISKAFSPLSAAEQKLVDEIDTPDRITVGDGELPDAESLDCTIRAELIRE